MIGRWGFDDSCSLDLPPQNGLIALQLVLLASGAPEEGWPSAAKTYE